MGWFGLIDFFEGTQIHFLCPSRPVLKVQVPIGVRDGADRHQAIFSTHRCNLRCGRPQPRPIDGTINDDMGNVNSLRPQLTGQALAEHAQASLRCGKVGKASLPSQTA